MAVAAGLGLQAGSTYQIDVSATAGGITRSDVSSTELRIVAPPAITSIPEAASSLNHTEATSDGGTPVNVSLVGTGAVAGQLLTVLWGGQTYSYVLSATDIANDSAAVMVPTSVLLA